jgi:hypothetical protein
MTTWRRWQDWGTIILGVLLFISPFAFGATAEQGAAVAAYAGGVLLVLAGLLNLASPENQIGEWAAVVIGVLLILSPWLLGFAGLTMMAWSAWVIGALAVLLAASVLFAPGGRPSQAAQS